MSRDKKKLYEYQKNVWIRKKYDAIDYLGGKCQHCGAVVHRSSFQFHHVDPKKKDVNWSKLRIRSWDKITEELDKCILLCANCHMYEHSDKETREDIEKFFREKKVIANTVKCKNCGVVFKGGKDRVNCSEKCRASSSRKNKISNEETLKVLIENNYNYSKTGRQLGITDNAVRKRAKTII